MMTRLISILDRRLFVFLFKNELSGGVDNYMYTVAVPMRLGFMIHRLFLVTANIIIIKFS